MSFRLWYPQLDVYDAIRRAGVLLTRWHEVPPSIERLQIIDFYFANPPLLHTVQMPLEIRKEFSKIEISKPEKSFLSFPSSPILFHKMEVVQKEAIQTLIGKGLINKSVLAKGSVQLAKAGRDLFEEHLNTLTSHEEPICFFLIQYFSQISINDINDLRRRTGLRRSVQ